MLTNFLRVFKLGWREIYRNAGISVGTIFIVFVSLFLIGVVFLSYGMNKNLISTLENKIDVSVYFSSKAEEKDIFAVKEKLESLPDVKNVEYISKEKALENFKETHKENNLFLDSLNEIGENPLPSSLNIQANASSSYANLNKFLEGGAFEEVIEKINYKQNQAIIDRLFSISDTIKNFGITASIVIGLIATVVVFNTIRLAIYSKREEIETMKLIGATNWFVRGPFMVQGLFLGATAGILSFSFFFFLNSVLSPSSLGIFAELGFLNFFAQNIFLFFAIQVGGGVAISIFSSFVASQRYLKI